MSYSNEISIKLNCQQAERLRDILLDYNDKGPSHEGWQSAEVTALYKTVAAQINAQANVNAIAPVEKEADKIP